MKVIKSLSTSQSLPFNELQNNILGLTSQVANFVNENTSFQAEISVLHIRVELLESRPVHSSDFFSVIFRESTECSKIEFNIICPKI